jgi:hypothetical protein
MAGMQAPGPDGIRRTRAVVVRNTLPQLRDTTLSSWNYWFKNGSGRRLGSDPMEVHAQVRRRRVRGAVPRRSIRPAGRRRVLSLEVTFAIIDEFVEIPKQIIDALSARCGRYPSCDHGRRHQLGHVGIIQPVAPRTTGGTSTSTISYYSHPPGDDP